MRAEPFETRHRACPLSVSGSSPLVVAHIDFVPIALTAVAPGREIVDRTRSLRITVIPELASATRTSPLGAASSPNSGPPRPPTAEATPETAITAPTVAAVTRPLLTIRMTGAFRSAGSDAATVLAPRGVVNGPQTRSPGVRRRPIRCTASEPPISSPEQMHAQGTTFCRSRSIQLGRGRGDQPDGTSRTVGVQCRWGVVMSPAMGAIAGATGGSTVRATTTGGISRWNFSDSVRWLVPPLWS